jgi:hypothetical protein
VSGSPESINRKTAVPEGVLASWQPMTAVLRDLNEPAAALGGSAQIAFERSDKSKERAGISDRAGIRIVI